MAEKFLTYIEPGSWSVPGEAPRHVSSTADWCPCRKNHHCGRSARRWRPMCSWFWTYSTKRVRVRFHLVSTAFANITFVRTLFDNVHTITKNAQNINFDDRVSVQNQFRRTFEVRHKGRVAITAIKGNNFDDGQRWFEDDVQGWAITIEGQGWMSSRDARGTRNWRVFYEPRVFMTQSCNPKARDVINVTRAMGSR